MPRLHDREFGLAATLVNRFAYAVLAKVFIVIGLVISAIGAGLAAWQLWFIRSWWTEPTVIDARRDMFEMIYDITVNSYRVPPYTAEERDAAIVAAKLERDERIESDRVRRQSEGLRDTKTQQRVTAWGLGLIVLGSLIQGIGTLIA